MKVKRVSVIVVILLGLFSLKFAIGHPGRTDKNGGHYNRKTGEYHYHSTPNKRGSATALSTSTYSALETTSKGSESKKATIHPVVPAEDFSSDTAYPVLRTIDGDTVELQYSGKPTTFRLIGVDTPETVHPQKAVEAFGKEASAFTRNLLLGEEVYLRFDTDKIDKYGRMLAYLYRAPDGLFVNLEIVRQGYGHAYTQFPFKYMELFRYYERRAREAGKGLWGNTAVSITTEAMKSAAKVEKSEIEQPSDQNQSDIVYITKTGSKYHRAGCRYLSKSAISITRQEAIARGYTPCSVCKP